MENRDFDVAVSFAGEDRAFVQSVVDQVKNSGFKVFYDEDFKHETWGEDLTEYFPRVYEERSRFVVMFISKDYAAKPWTRLERRSVLARALDERVAYLLPVRLDSTKLPGVRDTVGFLDGPSEGADGIARALIAKLGRPNAEGGRSFSGRVPRTALEAAVVSGERPPGWEYFLFSYHLYTLMDALATQYDDYRLGFALPDNYVSDSELVVFAQREQARMVRLISTFETLLLGPAQSEATGEPGRPGDIRLIEQLASRIIALYGELLDWTRRLRSLATQSEEAHEVALALAEYASQPIGAMRAFVDEYRQFMDRLTPRLEAGEDVAVTTTIAFEISDETTERFDIALRNFAKRLHP